MAARSPLIPRSGSAWALVLLAVSCDRSEPDARASAVDVDVLFPRLAAEPSLVLVEHGRFLALTDQPERARRCLVHADRVARFLSSELAFAANPRRCGIVLIDDDRIAEAIAIKCGSDLSAPHLGGCAGFFSRRTGLIHVRGLAALRDPDLYERLVAHEVAHEMVWASGYPLLTGPGAWVAEGIATFAETLPTDPQDVLVPQPWATERLAQAQAMAQAELLVPLGRFTSYTRTDLSRLRPLQARYPFRGAAVARSIPRDQVQSCALAAFLHESLGPSFAAWLHSALDEGGTPDLLERRSEGPMSAMDQAFGEWLRRHAH
ncbi:MAG: hypothetical protein AAF628_12865 [Planctomycetota bacterium]